MEEYQIGFLNLPTWQNYLSEKLKQFGFLNVLSAPLLGGEDMESPWVSLREDEFFALVNVGLHFCNQSSGRLPSFMAHEASGHTGPGSKLPKIVITGDSNLAIKRFLHQKNIETGIRGAIGGTFPMLKICGEDSFFPEPKRLLSMTDGVATYILSEIEQGVTFEEAIREAQWKGLASENPMSHVHGLIARDRLALLASRLFGVVIPPESIFTEGFGKIQREDFEISKFFHFRIRLLGIVEKKESGIEAWVRPCLIPNQYLLAQVRGGMESAYLICQEKTPLVYTGPGSTKEVILRGMLQDLKVFSQKRNFEHPCFLSIPVLPQEEMKNQFYIRVSVMNFMDSLALVSKIFAEERIPIKLLTQTPESIRKISSESRADVTDTILFTEPVCERNLKTTLNRIQQEVKLASVQCCLNYEFK